MPFRRAPNCATGPRGEEQVMVTARWKPRQTSAATPNQPRTPPRSLLTGHRQGREQLRYRSRVHAARDRERQQQPRLERREIARPDERQVAAPIGVDYAARTRAR